MAKSHSIKILLCGGLGNQLFQYAFGRALAIKTSRRLILDATTLFAMDTRYQRSYSLSAFSVPTDIQFSLSLSYSSKLWRNVTVTAERLLPLSRKGLIIEPRPLRYLSEYHEDFQRSAVTFIGYWQTPLYFQEVAEQLRLDLRFTDLSRDPRISVLHEIESTNSVCVHVRQNDYSLRLQRSYYSRAINEARRRIPDARFYVFGDDPKFLESLSESANDIVCVDSNGVSDIQDFRLMGRCKHFIIANSSFSWWAAWLAPYSEKNVYCPVGHRWSNLDSPCSEWTQIEE